MYSQATRFHNVKIKEELEHTSELCQFHYISRHNSMYTRMLSRNSTTWQQPHSLTFTSAVVAGGFLPQ